MGIPVLEKAAIQPFERPDGRLRSGQLETRGEDWTLFDSPRRALQLEDFVMRFKSLALVLAACVALAACGTNPTDRAVTGGAIGAGAGLAIGAVAGAPLLGAAVIGGAAGAVAGAVSDPNKVNLGRPAWEN
jgi:hypothetical protein